VESARAGSRSLEGLGRVLDDIVEEVTAKLAATSSTLPDTDPGSRSSRATLRACESVEEVTAARAATSSTLAERSAGATRRSMTVAAARGRPDIDPPGRT
jgi:hypothetical protein